MESYTLPKNLNFSGIEEAFKKLEDNENLKLRLPNGLKESGVFGLEGLVCQLIATWLRNNKGERIFHCFADKAEPNSFDKISSSFYGICILRLADKILLSNKEEVATSIALATAFERVKKIIGGDFESAYKGLYVAIPSIKSTGVNREFNNPLYARDEVIGKEAFYKLTEKALATVVPQHSKSAHINDVKEHVSNIIRELFDNTHKHARESEKGDILPINFRGIIFNSVSVSSVRLSELISSVGGKDMLLFSAEWRKWMDENKKNLPVLDITVVDAGPGYAKRWTGKAKDELTQEDEIEAVLQCFVKNNSTSPNIGDGSGLTHVLSGLRRLRGWFRLRTGSVAVSRSFFEGTGSLKINANDVNKMSTHIEGVSFNIVIPLVSFEQEGKNHV
ncbi:hypothetical protein [Saccharophagus degradans]|uniref:ATP-binding protein n=1 Tax=Saccharophagus degradans (strain 2-40 / ATCC 43961 / DSM 17024) TaxID=203122 RepID=Q21H22_SACD2|nr:hypothetical protein [Saccharophagus degradans]ABD82007.1 hypothetical protein Sde_2747 [Saccharophagus degradans 2-40]